MNIVPTARGHRTYLDLGRKTTPMDTRRWPVAMKGHRSFSHPIHIRPKEVGPNIDKADEVGQEVA